MGEYNADKEEFTLQSNYLGEIQLKVPVKHAPTIEQAWHLTYVGTNFIINADTLDIARVHFYGIGDQKFTYINPRYVKYSTSNIPDIVLTSNGMEVALSNVEKPPLDAKDKRAVSVITKYLSSVLAQNGISKDKGEIVNVEISDFGRDTNVRYVNTTVALEKNRGDHIMSIIGMEGYNGVFRVDFPANGQVKIDKSNIGVEEMLIAIKRLGDLDKLKK